MYRLVTCGTVEEKILRNQIFKSGLHRVVLEREHQQRYFTKQQLHALFDLGPTCMSQTHQELRELHGHQRTESIEIEQHRTDLEKECQEWMRGISDYHLLFSHLPVPPPESACDFIHTPSAVRTRTRKPDLSKTGPPKRARPHQAVVRRASVSSEMGIAKGDEDSMRWVTEFCSLSDFFGLDGQAQARLVACLRRARDAETRGGPKKRRERMDVLRHYLDGAELLVEALGDRAVTAGFQSKLLSLAGLLGISARAVMGDLAYTH